MINDWWRGAVIYQIYPRSFFDSNEDGVGDLAGITQKLDYVASLGVDMIWISPFYPSPMKDFGYDISDYKSVHSQFGTIADFKALLDRAAELELKVMVDLVVSHTSDRHLWFQESRSSRSNAKADWYVWADPQPDGTPPNNWLSIFGGSAWEWDTKRRQFYLHNFLTAQPDLNFHSPAVVDAVMDVVDYWLALGVHGFRLDTVNWYFHDRQLRSNPPNQGGTLLYSPDSSNYGMQEHIYNKSRPEVLPFLERLREKLDDYGAISLGELTAKSAIDMTPAYTEKGKRLNMVYTFELLRQTFDPQRFKQSIRAVDHKLGDGWVCWALSNHDVTRVVSRWKKEHFTLEQWAKLLLALLLSLRGAICLYQGEELGLTESEISFENLQDPFGKRLWPEYKGRDGCRTPMPWIADAKQGGFTRSDRPWLPLEKTHLDRAVDTQAQDEHSVLTFCRDFLRWRRSQPAILLGSLKLLDTADPVIAFERRYGESAILAVFNTSETTQSISGADYAGQLEPMEIGRLCSPAVTDNIVLPAGSVAFYKIA